MKEFFITIENHKETVVFIGLFVYLIVSKLKEKE